MFRAFYISLFIMLFSTFNHAQIPDGFLTPDFTVVDLDGNEHNLYEKLNEGKTVILDIYATWCGPCWTFHSDHVLADIWDAYGPDGTDEVFVMSIESDLDTGLDELSGISGATQGNWIEGTPYPMIDEMSGTLGVGDIAQSYFVQGYPTILFICPDRSVTEINWQNVESAHLDLIASCPVEQGTKNAKLLDYSGIQGIVCSETTFSPSVTFQNIGGETITDCVFNVTVNNTTEEINWTGNLTTFDIAEITFDEVTATNTEIIIELSSINGDADEFPENNVFQTSIASPTVTEVDTVIVEILTDQYGEETYWGILNENDELIAEGGNLLVGFDLDIISNNGMPAPPDASAYEANTQYNTKVALPANGCYRLVVADYYLDGICCDFGDGYFKVISQDNGVLFDGTGVNFEASATGPFALDGLVNNKDLQEEKISIFPNPAFDVLQIQLVDFSEKISTIEIIDLQGRTVYNEVLTDDKIDKMKIDIASFTPGFYMFQVKSDSGNLYQRKFVKN